MSSNASRRIRNLDGALIPQARVRVLVVDHDVESAESLASLLRAEGYEAIRVAYSGKEALVIAAEFRPEVVLLEIELLGMEGCELAQLLRERAQSQRVRLIALTSSRQHRNRELARVAGFERYLLKPVTPATLRALMNRSQ